MPPDPRPAECSVPDCQKPADSNRTGLCAMHSRRAQRGLDLEAPAQERLPPFEAFVRSCIGLADADSENDKTYQLAIDRARKAAVRWMRSLGYAKTPATDALAERVARLPPERVQRAKETAQRGSEQRESTAEERSRKAVPEGQERQSPRSAEVVRGDAGPGGKSRAGRDRPAGGADAPAEAPERGPGGRGGDSRPGGIEAVRNRARKAGAAR